MDIFFFFKFWCEWVLVLDSKGKDGIKLICCFFFKDLNDLYHCALLLIKDDGEVGTVQPNVYAPDSALKIVRKIFSYFEI